MKVRLFNLDDSQEEIDLKISKPLKILKRQNGEQIRYYCLAPFSSSEYIEQSGIALFDDNETNT